MRAVDVHLFLIHDISFLLSQPRGIILRGDYRTYFPTSILRTMPMSSIKLFFTSWYASAGNSYPRSHSFQRYLLRLNEIATCNVSASDRQFLAQMSGNRLAFSATGNPTPDIPKNWPVAFLDVEKTKNAPTDAIISVTWRVLTVSMSSSGGPEGMGKVLLYLRLSIAFMMVVRHGQTKGF